MIYFVSRTGNVQSIVSKLGLHTVNIADMDAPPNQNFVLFTYTDGLGAVPPIVKEFMEQHNHLCRGIICSGNTNFGQHYCGAGIKLSEQYGIPLGCKIDLRGVPSDLNAILTFYKQVIK